MVYKKASIQKFLMYSSYTVSSFVFMKDCSDFRGYLSISLLYFICLPNLVVVC